MTTLDRVRNLWKHAAQADARLFDVLRSDDETGADARRELAHIVGAEEVWLVRLEGRESRSAGRTFTDAVGDILLHVAMHGQYHRGKINLLLRQAGRTPVPADYIAFVRGAAAATNR